MQRIAQPKLGFVLALIATLFIHGCASVPIEKRPGFKSDPSQSVASNVIRAAWLNRVRDQKISRADYETYQKEMKQPASINTARAVLDVGVAATATPLGLATLANVGGAVAYWAFFKPADTRKANWVFAWVPASKASSEEEATKHVVDLIQTNLKPIMEDPIYAKYKPHPIRISTKYRMQYGYEMEGERCERKTKNIPACAVGMMTNKKTRAPGKPAFFGVTKVNMPDFTSQPGAPGYLLKAYLMDNGWSLARGRLKDLDTLSIFTRLSARLPDYVYLYLAPRQYGATREDGTVGPGRVPLVLNQGKALLFVVPKDG